MVPLSDQRVQALAACDCITEDIVTLDDLDLYPRLELLAQRSTCAATSLAILIFILAWSYRLGDLDLYPRLELLARRS